jgi:hypothetical protein
MAFPQQQWFCESALMLRHTYIACVVANNYEGDKLNMMYKVV